MYIKQKATAESYGDVGSLLKKQFGWPKLNKGVNRDQIGEFKEENEYIF